MRILHARDCKTRVISGAITLLVLLGAGAAYAHNVGSYDLFVPSLGGTTFSGTVAKITTTQPGVDNNTGISAGYHQYTAIYRDYDSDGSLERVTNKQEITSGQKLYPSYLSGQNVVTTGYRLGHTSKITCPVRVEAWGSWSPDQY